jgi:hypothetical protein
MNAEYTRLENEARECWNQLASQAARATVNSAADASRLEEQILQDAMRLGSMIFGMILVRSVQEEQAQQADRAFIDALPKRFHSQGKRSVTVSLRGGVSVSLDVRYYHRFRDPAFRRNRKAKHGLYPTLLRLGLHHRQTPAALARMATASALLGSFEEAARMLAGEGIQLSVNQLRKLVVGTGQMLRRLSESGSLTISGDVTGKRVVITTDGGRVRLREKRRGRTKKGRKRFQPQWREPRLFMIYVVDDEGRQDPAFRPIIDGGMGSCDELFALLLAYLQGLGVTEAARVQFVADGAAWIWNRVPGLIESLGLRDDQVQQLIDFWHAVEYLGKLADSSKLDAGDRKRWLKTQKKRLLRGEIGSVVDAILELTGRRRTRDQTTWLNYFITHGLDHRRMDYSTAKTHNMPIGSGAIESAIRRVINLRVKGNAIYWLRENAETMIRIRAWIKAGRQDELFQQTTYVTPELAL